MAMAKEDEVGALWTNTSPTGVEYMTGSVNGEKVVIFKNTFKQSGEKTPDWRVYRKEPKAASPVEDGAFE